MQLFSRKKALLAVSLSALSVLGACGDDVTVTEQVLPVTIQITPGSQTLNIGESANFSVQITGGSSSAPATLTSCTSSNTAVATAAVQSGACRVTAVSAGNATVTAASGTAQSSASVTVAAAAAAISNLVVSPSTANLAVGQSVTIVPNATKAATAVTTTAAYATSNAAVATVNATTGVVTAVAPGIATITVTLTGTGTGYTTTSLTSGVTVNVTAAPAGVTSLSVQPTSASLPVGGTIPLAASATQPTGAPAATITYGTNAPATATVSATGVVTGVAPGSAVITVTATSAAGNGFGASTASVLVPVTVTPQAQVIINSLTDNGTTIDITNVIGQFEVNLQLQPNGQNVQSVQAYVCDQGEAQAACIARGPAAQQTFGAAGGQAGPIQLYINSAEFTAPNFTTGADANTLYKNGLKTLVATVTTTVPSTAPNASNNLSQVAFNNPDGFTIQWTNPTNRANSAAGITWYGGPNTPDALLPGSTSGTGSFVVVPVIYTAGRTINQVTLGINGMSCGSFNDAVRPFGATYGTNATSTANANISCAGAASSTNGYVPSVTASIDNNNANGPTTTGGTPTAATSIFTQISPSVFDANKYRISLAYRPTNIYIPGDYAAPTINSFDVRGGGGSGTFVDSGWVNSAYSIVGGFDSNGNPVRYNVTDVGVGLLGTGTTTSARNALFTVCAAPASIPATTVTSSFSCTTPAATGGITSTIGSMSLGESNANFTNTAYVVIAAETDRLGNRATSVPFTFTSNANTGATTAATPATNAISTTGLTSAQAFGVDVNGPVLVVIPNANGTATNPLVATYARTDKDSIFSTTQVSYPGVDANSALFAIRFTDVRSGFPQCVNAAGNATATPNENCPAAAGGSQVSAGTFNITRRSAPASVSVTNDATVESIVRTANTNATAANRRLNVINATVNGGDPANRDFSINIFGAANRVSSSVTLTGAAPAASVPAYYTFSGSLVDRAGNSTALPTRSVAIDNQRPTISGITVPAALTGGSQVSFFPTGADDLEAISGDLALTYPQLGFTDGTQGAATQTAIVRYRRVPAFAPGGAQFGLWHSPFQSVTDNKLSTPVGPGTTLASSGLTVPTAFVQAIETVNGTDGPLAPGALAATVKPTLVAARLYDIRATSDFVGGSGPLWVADSGSSLQVTGAIGAGQVTAPSTAKNWGTSGTGGAGIVAWAGFDLANPGSVEFRVSTNTSITNPPFNETYVVRQAVGAAEWEYLGKATFVGSLDQGATRFWRYSFSFSGQSQAQYNMAALTNGDIIRAIGVDASGNGLSTRNSLVGQGGAFTNQTIVSSTVFPATAPYLTINNATAPIAVTLTPSANPNSANITYACSSNTPFVTATMGAGGVCTLAPSGSVVTAFDAQVTFTMTGTAVGFAPTTITRVVNVTRAP